jgi:hypothetical protein
VLAGEAADEDVVEGVSEAGEQADGDEERHRGL